MNKFFVVIFLVIFLQLNAIAQLPMNISNYKQKEAIGLYGKIASISLINSDTKSDKLEVKFKLKIQNNSSKPILLLKSLRDDDVPVYLGTKIREKNSTTFFVQDFFGESFGKSNSWMKFKNELDTKTPAADKVQKLMPKEIIEFDRTIVIYLPSDETKVSYFPKRESLDYLKNFSNLEILLYFQTWSRNLDVQYGKGENSFYKKLKKRWKRYGDLFSDAIVSEPIPFDLSSIIVKTDSKP